MNDTATPQLRPDDGQSRPSFREQADALEWAVRLLTFLPDAPRREVLRALAPLDNHLSALAAALETVQACAAIAAQKDLFE